MSCVEDHIVSLSNGISLIEAYRTGSSQSWSITLTSLRQQHSLALHGRGNGSVQTRSQLVSGHTHELLFFQVIPGRAHGSLSIHGLRMR